MLLKFIVAAIGASTPLLFGTVGEICSEKVGHLNLGVEGMMSIGACAGFMAGMMTDSFLIAVLAAFLAGMAGALIYAVLTVTFMADQNVSGLTLTIFGIGLANFIGIYMLGQTENGTLKLPEGITEAMRSVDIPGLSGLPVAGELLFFRKTKAGLNVQAIGHNPASADAAGVNVTRWKYTMIVLGGGICGVGGAYCAMIINSGVWISNNVGGLGWIAVALVIFAKWKPIHAIWGSFVFGALRVLKYYVPRSVVPVPTAFYDMLPFAMTALILVISSIRKKKDLNLPGSLGVNYFREER